MVTDESEFGQRVPLVIGTCMIGQIINIIRESEIDCLSTPWATARVVQLLSCWKSMAVLILGSAKTQAEGASRGPQEMDMDELVMVQNAFLPVFIHQIVHDTFCRFLCSLLVFLFLTLSCPKCALVWGMVVRGLRVKIFVRVLRSSRVNLIM